MILITSQFVDDPTVQRMCAVLRARAVDALVITPAALEEGASLTLSGDGGCVLRLSDRTIPLDEVRAAWLWRSWRPQPLLPRFRDLAQRPHEWSFFENEWVAFHKGFSLALAYRGVFCVNRPPFNIAFDEKCCQLMLAAQVGLRIPPTLYTPQPSAVAPFYEEHDGAVIYKPFRSYIHVVEPEGDGPARAERLLTNRVRAADLVDAPGSFPTPGIFQPYVEKELELRIVVVGRQLFTCAIHSQQSELAREDWRRYDFDHTPHRRYDLPPEIARKILALMERLGLVFGSVDMIVTPQGEYVFLEVNPSGQFDWIARLTGLPIYEHLAAMLVAGSVDYAAEPIEVAPYAD